MSFKRYPVKILKPLEEYLRAQREELVHQLEELEASDPYNQPDRANENEVGEDSYESNEHDQVVALKNQIVTSLKQLDETLERIEKGRYGFCQKCGKMINTDRLAVNPVASLCIECERQAAKAK
ncbi:MAG: hypothetical protein GXP43_03060 [bacterium]|nr:hypothetical protein [bacterium]